MKNLNLKQYKDFEISSTYFLMALMYKRCIESNPIVGAYQSNGTVDGKALKPVNFDRSDGEKIAYKDITKALMEARDFINGIYPSVKRVTDHYMENAIKRDAFKIYGPEIVNLTEIDFQKFLSFMDSYKEMISTSLKGITAIRKSESKEECIKVSDNLSEALCEKLTNTAKYISNFEGFGKFNFDKDYQDLSESYFLHFLSRPEIQKKVVEEKEIAIIKEEPKKVEETKVIDFQKYTEESEVEDLEVEDNDQERINCIEKANDLYKTLCNDFMIDLEKQIPYSVRKDYENFINVSFKDFVDKYKMPLSRLSSKKKAVTCCTAINNLFDEISEISSKAYVTTPVQREQ